MVSLTWYDGSVLEIHTVGGECAGDVFRMGPDRDRGRGHERVVRKLLVEDGGASSAAKSPQLEIDVRPVGVNRIHDLSGM